MFCVRYVDIVNRKRVHLIAAANIIGYGGTMISLTRLVLQVPQTKFHFFF